MMESKLYNQKGEESGKVKLPESVFGVSWNPSLVFQVVRSLQGNLRKGTAHTKDRSEVRGGGRKPWRQKGTGRARHGSIRSPIWRGGGVTFGPRAEKNYSKKINKKMRLKALAAVLSRKASDGEVILTENFDFKEPKTKEAREVLSSISKVKDFGDILSKKKNSALILLSDNDEAAKKSFSNLSNVKVLETRNLNVLDAVTYKYILISNAQDSLKQLAARFGVREKKEIQKTTAKAKTKRVPKKKVKKETAKTSAKTKNFRIKNSKETQN